MIKAAIEKNDPVQVLDCRKILYRDRTAWLRQIVREGLAKLSAQNVDDTAEQAGNDPLDADNAKGTS